MSARTGNCPNCGAAIEFRWSAAVQTICPACKSVLIRHDLDLERVGQVADVPPAMSGIQLGTEGRFKSQPFVVIGRILYKYGRGHWSEWYIRFANDEDAWLSDAQGDFAITRKVALPEHLADPIGLSPGQPVLIGDDEYSVATITRAAYGGVEGELPFTYWDKDEVLFVDLKKGTDALATIDYSDDPPLLFVGEYETADELELNNLRDGTAAGGPDVSSKGLNCPQCGAAIELRTGALAVTVACPACTAILDPQDPNLRILLEHQTITSSSKQLIPLGAIGRFKGEEWQVIGYQVVSIEVEGVSYAWREYLLWSAARGFRFLTEYEGHWNDVSTVKGVPRTVDSGSQPVVEYLGTRFKHFQRAAATTRFVLGEFPWEVRVGDQVMSDDFVAPPLMLSREVTDDEITWSLGTYTPPERIAEAFKLDKPLPSSRGVFANQPSPTAGRPTAYGKAFAMLALGLMALFVIRMATAKNEQVFSEGYRADAPDTAGSAFVTPEFTLPGAKSNVAIEIGTGLSNDWAFFNIALLSSESDRGYEIGRDVSYYAGVDQGESWSEGSSRDRVVLPSIPGGRYYLRIDTERGPDSKPFNYTVTVKRDVPRVWPFLVGLLLLALPPIFVLLRAASFEQARWRESDHAPSTDDDDE